MVLYAFIRSIFSHIDGMYRSFEYRIAQRRILDFDEERKLWRSFPFRWSPDHGRRLQIGWAIDRITMISDGFCPFIGIFWQTTPKNKYKKNFPYAIVLSASNESNIIPNPCCVYLCIFRWYAKKCVCAHL